MASSNSPYSYFSDLFNKADSPAMSLDIETTSIFPKHGKIWSVGMKSKNFATEMFLNPLQSDFEGDERYAKRIAKHFRRSGRFNDSQLRSGAVDDLLSATKKGQLISPEEMAKRVSESIKPSSLVLIQNAPFENRWFRSYYDRMEAKGVKPERPPTLSPTSVKERNSLFQVPPSVVEARDIARANLATYQSSSDPNASRGLLEKYASSQREVISRYQSAFSSIGQNSMTMDMMDLSRAMYAEAALKGHIDPRYMSTGTRVDFLSQIFLGEKERHTALSDSDKQLRLAEKIAPLTQRIVDDSLTQEDLDLLAKIKRLHPAEHESQAIAGALNRLEEFRAGEKPRMPTGIWSVRSVGENVTNRGKASFYTESSTRVQNQTQLLALILEQMKQRGQSDTAAFRYIESLGMGRHGKTDDEIFSSLQEMNSRLGSVNYISDTDEQIAAKRIQDSEIPEKFASAIPNAETKKSESKMFGSAVTDSLDFVKKHKGKFAFGAGLLVLANMNFTNSDKISENRKRKKEESQDSKTIERAINLYDASYHGDGFVAWNNRKNHHQM